MKNIIKVIISLTVLLALFIAVIYSFNNENNVYHGIYDSNKNYFEIDTAIAIMYETDNGNYEVSDGTSWLLDGYKFNETLSGCENGGTISWNDATQKVEMKTNISDKCYVYFDAYNPTFAEYIINSIYTTDGENGLYYHDGIGSYTNADQEAGDNSYRYSGADPNNYVCFGSDAETCPNEHLYRIIGVFDDNSDSKYSVKLIKTTSLGNYAWSSNSSNNWTGSTLNTELNGTYFNNLGSTWNEMIDVSTWYLGALSSQNNSPKSFYNGERNNAGYGSNPKTYDGKIGLMYVSDYGYAASSSAWATNLSSYSSSTIISSNWLYLGLWEWVLTPLSAFSSSAFYINYNGSLSNNSVSNFIDVRPTFYLKANISYVSGTGTESDPYRIS